MINRKAFLTKAVEEGFKNKVNGYPLILKHSKGRKLLDYKIYGNSVQDGTPTPDNPIEIQSVGDLVVDKNDANYGKYKIPVKVNDITTNIYLKEPLRKIGNYADYIDFVNQKVVRNTKLRKFTGDEKWYISGKNFALANWDDGLSVTHVSAYAQGYKCNIAKENSSTSYKFKTHNNQGIDWIIFDFKDDITTLEGWKSYLKANDVYVIYSLATPTEETIELPTIPTNEGTNIIEVDKEVLPSNMEAEYSSFAKEV